MRPAVWVWAVAGVILALTARVSAEHLWVLSIVPHSLWLLYGVVAFGVLAWRARAPAQRRRSIREAGIVLAVIVLYEPVSWLGDRLTERLRFVWQRPAYDRVVEDATALSQTNPGLGHGVEYVVDPGPPVRVAFPWPGGIIDNWCGAIFDPSGEVLKINDLPLGTPQWRNAVQTRLFGGDMVSCHPLDPPYYLCCFT